MSFVVRSFFKTNAPGLYGWDCHSVPIAGAEAALAAFDRAVANRRYTKVQLLRFDEDKKLQTVKETRKETKCR